MRTWQKFIAGIGDCAWVVDAQGRIVFWNSAACDSLGYRASEAKGLLCHQLLAGQTFDGKPFCRAGCSVIRDATRGRSVRGFDLSVLHCDGTRVHASVSIITFSQASRQTDRILIAHVARRLDRMPVEPLALRIHLLGTTAVVRADGAVVDGMCWRRAKVRMLFALLALHRGRPVHRDRVLETIWPNSTYTSALHSLTSTVYNLRHSLQPALLHGRDSDYVGYVGDGYVLNNSPNHWLDVEAFESGIAQARAESEPARAVRLYRDALSLYGGDFLADLGAIQEWCCRERERLCNLRLNALEELACLQEQLHEPIRAHELYRQILSIDPCRESACRRLMHLSLGRGDRATAVYCFRDLTESLRRELDIAPSQETREVYEIAIKSN